jgi:hypothetical protein
MEKTSGGCFARVTRKEDEGGDDEDDWEMTLNRYETLG